MIIFAWRSFGACRKGGVGKALAPIVAAVLFGVSGAASAQVSCGASDFTQVVNPSPPLPPTSSLPTGTPRPGPDILYWPLATSPQLENTGPWTAEPIRVLGSSAYRAGEFLYQDFLYDDAGGRGTSNNAGAGTYTYPTNPLYAGNAADLVEVRLKLLTAGTAIRLTYNTMLDPSLVATTIALGTSSPARAMPYGANTTAPAQVFVTVHGATGDVVAADTGAPVPNVAITVVVDQVRRQVHLCVPYQAYDPRGNTAARVAVASGLWDNVNGKYLVPSATAATATTPGGVNLTLRPKPSAFFNVAFRFDEALSQFSNVRQGTVLATGDMSPFFANVDFTKLQAHVNDDMPGQLGGVPQSGYMNRLLVSHFEDAQGRGNAASLEPVDCAATNGCLPPAFAGRLQPYELYVPATPPPYGLQVHPHAAGGSHNFYIESGRTKWQPEAAARGTGSIAITGNARGQQYWYFGEAAADIFEIWADVAARYQLDPGNTVMAGLSMGGYGTYKFGAQYPDLFSSATTVVGCTIHGGADLQNMLKFQAPSFRNIPIYAWTGTADTLCPYSSQVDYFNVVDGLGYRYDWFSFLGVPHAGFDNEFQPMVDWIGDKRVNPNPFHVTYVLNDAVDEPEEMGLNADHAYWLSDMKIRNAGVTPPIGTVDVFSHGFGLGDPPVNTTQNLTGQFVGPYTKGQNVVSYNLRRKDWGPTPQIPIENKLDITAQNVSDLTIYPARARVDCNAVLNVQTDGLLTVRLDGCGMPTAVVPSSLQIVPAVLSLRMLTGVIQAVFTLPPGYSYAGGAPSNLKLYGAPAISVAMTADGKTMVATFNKRDLASLPVGNATRVTLTGNFTVGGEQVQVNAPATLRVMN